MHRARLRPESHPERIAWAAFRRGATLPAIETCRVLEIGCGDGTNIVPLAFHMPRARVVGIDRSRDAITAATGFRDRVGAANLDLRVGSSSALSRLGKFDFIFVHDALGTGRERDRNALLAACSRALNPRGLLAFDLPVLPGGAFDTVIGALARRAGADGATDEDARDRFRHQLDRLAGAIPTADEPHLALLRAEIAAAARNAAAGQRDWPTGAVAFADFVAEARACGLAFVAEGSDAGSEAVVQMLRASIGAFERDAIAVEQALDVITHRRMRLPILGIERARGPAPSRSDRGVQLWFAGPLSSKSQQVSLADGSEEVFVGVRAAVAAKHPLLKAALVAIGRNSPVGLRLEEVTERARGVLTEANAEANETAVAALEADLLAMCDGGVLEARLREPIVPFRPGISPRACMLTRVEAERGSVLTTPHHEALVLDRFERAVTLRLDGTRDIGALVEELLTLFQSGALNVMRDNEPVRDEETLRDMLPRLLTAAVFKLTSLGLIEMPQVTVKPLPKARSRRR